MLWLQRLHIRTCAREFFIESFTIDGLESAGKIGDLRRAENYAPHIHPVSQGPNLETDLFTYFAFW